MDANLIQGLTILADIAIAGENKAREELAASLTDPKQGIDTYRMRRVLEAAAEAAPWRKLLEDAETVGFEKALRTLRKRLTRQLLSRSITSSTCQITNEAARLEVGGYQNFLGQADVLDD